MCLSEPKNLSVLLWEECWKMIGRFLKTAFCDVLLSSAVSVCYRYGDDSALQPSTAHLVQVFL